ncbi:MAG: nitroreductase, partial [Actinobacteria bacterium]|nr:nitroreductase [Actinomycetota bacterium]
METYDAIMSRRSVPRTAGRLPDRQTIAKLIAAAVRAPTHHITQPWRFIVLAGDSLEDLGEAWATGAERLGQKADGLREKARRAPVVLCVIETPKAHLPKVVEIEEHYAIGAAMQNVLLAAHSMGMAAMLRTGATVMIPEVREYLGVTGAELVAGFIYLGYPREGDDERPRSRRTDC